MLFINHDGATDDQLKQLLAEKHCVTCHWFGSPNVYSMVTGFMLDNADCRRYAPGGSGFAKVVAVNGCGDHKRDVRELRRKLDDAVVAFDQDIERAATGDNAANKTTYCTARRDEAKRWLRVLTDVDVEIIRGFGGERC